MLHRLVNTMRKPFATQDTAQPKTKNRRLLVNMAFNPLTATDFYKTGHIKQYPPGTEFIYANYTPRSSGVVFFGLQYFIKDFLIKTWNEQFFKKNKTEVVETFKARMDYSLGQDTVDVSPMAALHDLGYLPLDIKALPEGTYVPKGVPLLTIVNTHPQFFWLTTYIESVMSCHLWKPTTSATTARAYKQLLTKYAVKTGAPQDFVALQVHDFSFRGMSSLQDSALTGAAHLLSFRGTDSIPGIDLLADYYNANADEEIIGCSIPATEHSVMCMGTKGGELETFRRLINDIYPHGPVSIVADTWDFWKVVTEYLVTLKDEILRRDGKVVIRPDSGDPIKIIVGDPDAAKDSPEYKGTVECLWDIFGGTKTNQGYNMLDAHIGVIYGDSINFERTQAILEGLAQKGFCSSNIVFGVGSCTYQHVTRDNHGFALKATSAVVNGERREIFKDPKTARGTKTSAKGLLRVECDDHTLVLHDRQTEAQEAQGLLKTVFKNGKLTKETSLSKIRQRVDATIF